MINVNLIQNALGFIFNEKRFSVYDKKDQEVLGGFSVMSYSVNEDSQFIEHPIETGATIADHHVFNPIEIDCRVAMPPKGFILTDISLVDIVYGRAETFENTYNQLVELYKTSSPLKIKTEANVYTNMYITAMPTDLDVNTADRQIFNITFKEAITVQPQYIKFPVNKVKNPANSSYVKTGEVLPQSVNQEAESSVLYRLFN